MSTHLYGYSLGYLGEYDTCTIIENDQYVNGGRLSPNGAWVLVEKRDNRIEITQDYMGSFGLYLYKSDRYFAVSNSFELLIESIPCSLPLTLNNDYIDYYLVSSLSAHSCEETPFNEIVMLDRNSKVIISKGTCEIEHVDYHEGSVEINSKKALEVLDKWYEKWGALIRNINEAHCNIRTDLSGGFDSRLVLALFLGSGIDINAIRVNSIKDDEHTHKEDYEIATDISNAYGFKLNRDNFSNKCEYMPVRDIIENSIYCKSCAHKQFYLKRTSYVHRQFSFAGGGGEIHRGYWSDFNKMYDHEISGYKSLPGEQIVAIGDSIKRVMDRSCNYVCKKYSLKRQSEFFGNYFYRENRARLHSARAQVESYACNEIILNPLLDYELGLLKNNTSELCSLIIYRYQPKLADFKFDSGRELNPDIVKYVKNILDKYGGYLDNIEQNSNNPYTIGDFHIKGLRKPVSIEFIQKMLSTFCHSEYVTQLFAKYDHFDILDRLLQKCEKRTFNKMQEYYGIISLSKVYEVYEKHLVNNKLGYYKWFSDVNVKNRSSDNPEYYAARIDIKNYGKCAGIETIYISDPQCHDRSPPWYEGGHVYSSCCNQLVLEIKCINTGNLRLSLKGQDIKNYNGDRIPIKITYTLLKIDNNVVFNQDNIVWHDSPFYYNLSCHDGQIVHIEVIWHPL